MDFNSLYQDALSFGLNLRDCYKNGDKNGDGHLSKQELKEALQDFTGEAIGKPEMDELLDEMDPDGDGKITYKGSHQIHSVKGKDPLSRTPEERP